jgi:hypothetical protein
MFNNIQLLAEKGPLSLPTVHDIKSKLWLITRS